jgi:hypothetical protein
MGSKSSKLVVAALTATSLAIFPGAAGAITSDRYHDPPGVRPASQHLDYSKNSVNGEYNVSPSPSSPSAPAPTVRVVTADAGFSWGDALAGAGVTVLFVLALGGAQRFRRRRVGMSPRASSIAAG